MLHGTLKDRCHHQSFNKPVSFVERKDACGRESFKPGRQYLLFMICIFNDAVSNTDDTVNGCMIMNIQLRVGRIWKESDTS